MCNPESRSSSDYNQYKKSRQAKSLEQNNKIEVVDRFGKLLKQEASPTGEFSLIPKQPLRNLLLDSEFQTRDQDTSIWGLASPSDFPGFSGGAKFITSPYEGAVTKYFTGIPGEVYSFSAFVRMNDESKPRLYGLYGPSSFNDFAIMMFNLPGQEGSYPVVKNVGSGLYRVSRTARHPAYSEYKWNSLDTFGIQKYFSNTIRPFRVTGYQLEQSEIPGEYIKTEPTGVLTLQETDLSIGTKRIREDQGFIHILARAGFPSYYIQTLLSLHDSTVNNRLVVYRNEELRISVLCVIDGSTVFKKRISDVIHVGQLVSLAVSFNEEHCFIACNGREYDLSSSFKVPVINAIDVGSFQGTKEWFGRIFNLDVGERLLPLSRIKEMTVP